MRFKNSDAPRRQQKSRGFLALGSLLFSYALSWKFPGFWLPWSLNIVPFAFSCFFIGASFRDLESPQIFKFNWLFVTMAVAGCTLAGVIFFDWPGMNLRSANYGIPGLTLLAAVSWSLFLFQLANYLLALPRASLWLASLGRASLLIMFVHQPLQLTLKRIEPFHSIPIRLLAAVVVPFALYHLLLRNRLTSRAFLGEERGFAPAQESVFNREP